MYAVKLDERRHIKQCISMTKKKYDELENNLANGWYFIDFRNFSSEITLSEFFGNPSNFILTAAGKIVRIYL